jgi:hypothetical protein
MSVVMQDQVYDDMLIDAFFSTFTLR